MLIPNMYSIFYWNVRFDSYGVVLLAAIRPIKDFLLWIIWVILYSSICLQIRLLMLIPNIYLIFYWNVRLDRYVRNGLWPIRPIKDVHFWSNIVLYKFYMSIDRSFNAEPKDWDLVNIRCPVLKLYLKILKLLKKSIIKKILWYF